MRPFEPRSKVGYHGDIQALMRMAKAVRLDDSRSEEWRHDVVHRLEEVVKLMLQSPVTPAESSDGG